MKRGQAAMEFLMTYGWAILVLLVMVGALSYFGILNPNKVVPERCFFGAGFNCKDYQVREIAGTSTRVAFVIENKQGDSILIQGINVTAQKSASQFQPTVANCGIAVPTAAIDVDNGYSITCDLPLAASNGIGERQKFNIMITFSKLF